jgi:hypothetical protein
VACATDQMPVERCESVFNLGVLLVHPRGRNRSDAKRGRRYVRKRTLLCSYECHRKKIACEPSGLDTEGASGSGKPLKIKDPTTVSRVK